MSMFSIGRNSRQSESLSYLKSAQLHTLDTPHRMVLRILQTAVNGNQLLDAPYIIRTTPTDEVEVNVSGRPIEPGD